MNFVALAGVFLCTIGSVFRLTRSNVPAGAGCIMGLSGARKLYTTSNGGVTIRATTHTEVCANSGGHKTCEHCCGCLGGPNSTCSEKEAAGCTDRG